jgi:hypothetical protein
MISDDLPLLADAAQPHGSGPWAGLTKSSVVMYESRGYG